MIGKLKASLKLNEEEKEILKKAYEVLDCIDDVFGAIVEGDEAITLQTPSSNSFIISYETLCDTMNCIDDILHAEEISYEEEENPLEEKKKREARINKYNAEHSSEVEDDEDDEDDDDDEEDEDDGFDFEEFFDNLLSGR